METTKTSGAKPSMQDVAQDVPRDRKVLDEEKGETLSIHSSDASPDNDSDSIEKQDDNVYEDSPPISKTDTNIARRVLTHLSKRSSHVSIGPPPDGGFKAWLQCSMSCMVVTTTW